MFLLLSFRLGVETRIGRDKKSDLPYKYPITCNFSMVALSHMCVWGFSSTFGQVGEIHAKGRGFLSYIPQWLILTFDLMREKT